MKKILVLCKVTPKMILMEEKNLILTSKYVIKKTEDLIEVIPQNILSKKVVLNFTITLEMMKKLKKIILAVMIH